MLHIHNTCTPFKNVHLQTGHPVHLKMTCEKIQVMGDTLRKYNTNINLFFFLKFDLYANCFYIPICRAYIVPYILLLRKVR